jgi:threonine aldolase
MELEETAAQMLGKDAAVFTVSGSMSNTVALRTHSDPGGTAVVEASAHVYGMEYSAIASACGLLVMTVPGHHGMPDVARIRECIIRASAMFPARSVVCIENTHNAAGGTVLTPAQVDKIGEVAHGMAVSVHLDGARLFNAAVALGVDVRQFTRSVDTVSVCLSKGLSAPIGSVLAGSDAFISRARRVRKSFGGAMRQAGVIAAPGLVALRTMVGRLKEDHEHAALLAASISDVPGLSIDLGTVQTNIVNVDVGGLGIDASIFATDLGDRGVRGLPGLGNILRFVTYRNISRADVVEAARIIREVATERPWTKEAFWRTRAL